LFAVNDSLHASDLVSMKKKRIFLLLSLNVSHVLLMALGFGVFDLILPIRKRIDDGSSSSIVLVSVRVRRIRIKGGRVSKSSFVVHFRVSRFSFRRLTSSDLQCAKKRTSESEIDGWMVNRTLTSMVLSVVAHV